MQIKAYDADAFPRTRREWLSHMWAQGFTNANIFREGAIYAVMLDKTIYATHCRTIGSWSFGEWETKCRERYFGS